MPASRSAGSRHNRDLPLSDLAKGIAQQIRQERHDPDRPLPEPLEQPAHQLEVRARAELHRGHLDGFLQGAQQWWSAISVAHLANGIHGVEYLADGTWHAASMNGDMGHSYIIGGLTSGATQFQIRVRDGYRPHPTLTCSSP
jgi:hypothetical protein